MSSLISGIDAGTARRPVAVDDETRIILLDQHRVERIGQCAADPGDADIPGDVAFAFGFGDAEPAERPRHAVAGVIGDEQQRRRPAGVIDRDRAPARRPLTAASRSRSSAPRFLNKHWCNIWPKIWLNIWPKKCIAARTVPGSGREITDKPATTIAARAGEFFDENSRRLRDQLRMPAADADDPDAQRASVARRGPCHP